MIPLSKITGEKNPNRQTKYNRRIPLSQIIGTTSPQEEPEKDSGGGLFDTAGNAFDWWKNNSLAGAGFLGGLASETAGNILQNLGLESAGNLAQNAADEMLDFGAKKVYTADGDNFSGSFANQLMSGLIGSFGRLASMIHSDKTADTMIKSSDSLANKTPVSTDNLAEYFTNPRGFASDTGQLAGSMAAIVPFMGLAPEAAAARGVAALGGDAITQALINRGLYGAAKVFAGGAPRAAQYALTSAPVEGAMEGGETRRELLNQGASEEEATKESLITMGKNIPLLLATNALEGLAFFSPLKGANKALQIGGRAAANSAQQQYEEFAQEGIQNAALGKPAGWLPWNGAPEQYEAAERVRYPALLMGGFGGAAQALGGRNENQENFERGSQENISVENFANRANKAGQNLWTWASNISGGQMSDGVFNSIVRNAQELGVDPKLALALATAESNGNQDDISPVGAIGVMQLMPETAQGLGVDPYDQEQNIRGGLTYLKQQLDRFNGDWDLAAAAYNAGAGAVEKYGGIPPYAETQGYVERINGFLGESPEYQGGEESLGNEGITYLGENGKGEGKYWVRNPNMNVSTEGMRPESLNALDILGKYYFDHTGKPLILNAGTNGDHAAGEFSHANGWKFDIIDQLEGDGALITADYGRGEFLNQFIKYGRSLGLGMNFEGEGTSNVHLDVAVDGTQWDGNGDHAGGFNLDRVRATAPKKSRSKQSPQSQTQRTNQEEPTKPLFDINTEDSTTQKLLEQFAKERFSKAVDDEDAEPVNFFNGMFDDKDTFQNTPENRNAIIERYGDEFKTWAANQNQNQQEQPQPAKTNSNVKQADDPYKRRAEIKNTANKFLEQLRATGDPNKASVVFGLQNALNNGNFAEVENILKQNGMTISQPQSQSQPQAQPSQDPVRQNTPPENILSQPKQKSSPLERKIKVASAPVKIGNKGLKSRKKQGAVLIDLATQNGIEIPNPEVIALTKGSTKAVQKWRDNLMQAGAFKTTAPQTQGRDTTEIKTESGTTVFTPDNYTPPQPSLKERAQAVIQKFKARQKAESEADLTNEDDAEEKFIVPNPVRESEDFDSAEREDDLLLQREDELGRQEEHAKWKAKQDKELEELQARQAEEKRLREEARRESEAENSARSLIDIFEDDDFEDNLQREIAGEDVQAGIQPRVQSVQTAQADESTRQVQEDYRRPQAEQSRQASELVQQELAQATAQNLRTRQQTSQPQPAAIDNVEIPAPPQIQAQQEPTQAAQAPKTPKRSKKAAALHAKFKTDTHPLIGAYLDDLLKNTKNKDSPYLRSKALKELKIYEERDATDETLDKIEARLREEQETQNAKPETVDNEKGKSSLPRTTAETMPARQWKANKAVLKQTLEGSDLGEETRSIFKFLHNLMNATEQNSLLSDKKLHELHDFRVEKLTDYPKDYDTVIRTMLRGAEKTNGEVHYTGTHDLDTLSISPYGVATLVENQIKDKGLRINERGLTGDAKEYFSEYIKEARARNEEIRQAKEEENKPENKIKKLEAEIQAAKSHIEEYKAKLETAKKENDERTERFLAKDIEFWQKRLDHMQSQLDESKGESEPTKFSREGEVDTRIENFVDDKNLTPQQKLHKSFGEKLGVKTVFFRNEDGDFHGAHASGTTYINVNSNKPLGKVFWHESLHWLKKNNADLYGELAKAADITDEQRDAYLERSERNDLYTDEAIDEEIIADQMEDVAKRTGLLQNIAGKNRGLIQRVVQWLKDTMNKFIDHFRNPDGKLTTNQSIALADEFGKIAKDLVDPNGEKIFRYNNRTHNIELADGRGLNDETQTKKALADLAKAAWNDKNFNGKVSFTPSKKFRDKAQEIFGHDVTEIFITGSDIRRIKKKHGANEDARGQIDMTPEIIPDIYDVVNDFDFAEESKTDNLGQKAIEVIKNINGGQGYVITVERGTKKAEVKTALKRKKPQVLDTEGSEQNVRNDPATYSDKNISQGEDEIKYSLGNSDNSSESLKQKIKNKLSAYFDDRPSARRKKRITENLRALSGHRILYGNVKGADDIVVDHMQKLIQSRNTYDWEKLLPVVGKEIAKQLKLNPTSEQSNYIADWLLTGALNNTSAEAKNFQKAMRENPAQAELLQQTRDIFQEISDMSPWERVGSSLVERKGKTFLEKLGIGEGSFEEQFVNDLAGLTKLVDDAAKNSTPAVAEMIRRGCSPDKLAQLSRGKGAIAELMVKSKTHDIENVRAALSEIYPAIDFSRFKPLEAIFESVGGDVKGLEIFAVAKLTKEICEHNRANPDDKITPYISEADADHIISTGEKKFGQAQKDLVNFSNTLLGMQYDSGLLTDNQFFRILKKWKNYVPMARVFDENENYDKLDFLKKRKGHENDTWSPIQTMIDNANKVVQACEQNKVKLEIANLVRFGGFDSNLSEVASSNPDVGNIIRFKENGKTKYLETPDPAIKRAVDALQSQSEGAWLVKMLRAATSFMRIRYTGGNVDFAASNPFRDIPDAYVHNQHLGLTTPITELIDAWRIGFKGAWRAFTGKPLTKEFIEWQIHGGAQASFVSGDVDYIQRSINDATTTRLQRYRQRPFTQLLDDFQKISEFTENITRLSTYTLAKKQLAKRNGGVASLSDKQLAAHASREASIDFAKAGISTRKINNFILFANAAVQGLAQWGYAVREAKRGNSKPLFGKVFRAMTHAVCLAMLQFALAHGDDERKKEYEQAPAWEKETYWILGGVRIPKGMDVGIRLMANFTDEALGALFDKKSFDVQRLGDTLKNALPSITATVITPALEVKMNHSIFRDAPIVPRSKENLNPEHQFDTNTSSVAKLFGQMTGWSPFKIDYLIQGYLGTMGRFAAHVPNYVERGGIGLDEMPMIRRFVFEPYKNPQIVKDYYEAYDEQFSHYNTYKLTREKPDGFDPALYKRLKAAQEPMRKISKLEKRILDDPKLTYDERKAKIRELEKRRIALCENVFRRAQ